jgi:hypothetical protein
MINSLLIRIYSKILSTKQKKEAKLILTETKKKKKKAHRL